jgi:hypothetical protein
MWKEMLTRYPQIPQAIRTNQCSLSFELYGARNDKTLIKYEVPLDTALLFGISEGGAIRAPSQLVLSNMPIVPLEKLITHDYIWEYETIRREKEVLLKKVEDGYVGDEGSVWYLFTPDGNVIQYKCKPPTIEEIHWSQGAHGISFNGVVATCWNALESCDELKYEALLPLLREEWSEDEIEQNRGLVDRAIRYVRSEAEFKERVLKAYRELPEHQKKDLPTAMRSLSALFGRAEMKKVFVVVVTHAENN